MKSASISETTVSTKRKKRINIREWQLYSMCAVPMLLVFVFNYLPMGGLVIAFKNYKYSKGIFGSEWVGFDNFEFFLKSSDFLRLVRNTIGLNFLFIIFSLISAIVVAILLFELRSRASTKIFQTLLLTPRFQSWVVVSYMLYAFLHKDNGILNQFLSTAFNMAPIDWYASPNAWPIILILAYIWKGIGIDAIMYYASLMGVDSTLFEAAEIDGASRMKIYLKIVLPSLVPLITVLTILKIGNIFRADFGMFYQLTRDVPALYVTTDVVDTYIFRTMRKIGDMGMSSAVGFLQSIVGMILVLVTNACAKKIDPDIALF